MKKKRQGEIVSFSQRRKRWRSGEEVLLGEREKHEQSNQSNQTNKMTQTQRKQE